MAAAELSSTVGLRQDRVTERWKGETTTTEREIDKHPSRKNDWSAFAKKKKKKQQTIISWKLFHLDTL